jgi:tetratricopeptide (TPR) repeat protein
LLWRLGDEQEALALHRRRLELAKRVCKMAPDRPGAIFGLYMAHCQLAALVGVDGDDSARQGHMQAAYELARGLAQREPDNRQYAVALAGSLRGLAADDLNAGRTELAMQRANDARQLIWPMVESDPEHLDGLEAAATIHALFADAAARRGEWREALREYREARSMLEKIRSRRPDNPIHRMHLLSLHGSLETVAQIIGDVALQRSSRDAMAAICREVLADAKAAASDLAGCAQWWSTNHLVTEQDHALALAGAKRAAEMTRHRMPQMQLALAEVQARIGRQEEALATLDRALAATPPSHRMHSPLQEARQRMSDLLPTALRGGNPGGGST